MPTSVVIVFGFKKEGKSIRMFPQGKFISIILAKARVAARGSPVAFEKMHSKSCCESLTICQAKSFLGYSGCPDSFRDWVKAKGAQHAFEIQ
jgi:hypothetical protein